MKFLTLAVPATLVMGVVAMPVPSTSKAARLSGENLLDGLANDGGLSGFLSGVHLPFLNPSPKKDTQDPSDEDPDDVPARDDKGPGADEDSGPAEATAPANYDTRSIDDGPGSFDVAVGAAPYNPGRGSGGSGDPVSLDVAVGAAPNRNGPADGVDDDNNGDGPADAIYGPEDTAGVGAGVQDGTETH
ncbi:hypothetical protein BO79DRAFT_272461 [Aspergillus costaricaensis CBS 115574]|uniref:Uncharacterized protein n=1 Tax=Aspergillus costaricaensis CBS 115574 TaxID=1448317 RepID=A0ACD1ITI1_9EURO|nr:hypothetical protein BO79DRAFT_272461 [Aspergillus costaricaensis CBS 115574]RAK93059.1 hypothetical protein BO79DRAFT_272461 [Aspergillus costaricaensis CBS 115574]